MKTLLVLYLTVCMFSGCTTLRVIPNVPNDLSQHFGDGGVLHPGDRVIITTVAGAKSHWRIRTVRDGVIYGKHDSIPFSEIALIERRDFSAPKTTLLVVVSAGVVGAIAAVAFAAAQVQVRAL
jgi:hypothetical protein